MKETYYRPTCLDQTHRLDPLCDLDPPEQPLETPSEFWRDDDSSVPDLQQTAEAQERLRHLLDCEDFLEDWPFYDGFGENGLFSD